MKHFGLVTGLEEILKREFMQGKQSVKEEHAESSQKGMVKPLSFLGEVSLPGLNGICKSF